MAQVGQDAYEYSGLMAEAWDLLRGDTSNWPDRAFFLDLIGERGQPVLDVGCGTGRLLVDYASHGIDIDGADNSPEMLALCREKAEALNLQPTLFEQRMEALELPRKYQTIIVPSSSIQLLIEPAAVQEAFHRFYDHLLPGGTLAIPFMLFQLAASQTEEQAKKWFGPRESEREDGSLVRRWSRFRYDRETQLEHTEDRYEVIVDGEIVETEHFSRSPATRWYSQEQSKALFEEAGFVDLKLHEAFTGEPAAKDARVWTIVGSKN
jgi:ubiquinone/menaquinone biosynthesis C-methylase UbiE